MGADRALPKAIRGDAPKLFVWVPKYAYMIICIMNCIFMFTPLKDVKPEGGGLKYMLGYFGCTPEIDPPIG